MMMMAAAAEAEAATATPTQSMATIMIKNDSFFGWEKWWEKAADQKEQKNRQN